MVRRKYMALDYKMNKHKTRVLITIDTEVSIGGYFRNRDLKPVPADRHIYCKIKGRDYGINLIMDILDRYQLKGVFFVETEARHYFGNEEISGIIRNIKERGHEIQLHIHPNYRTFIHGRRLPDDMGRFSVEEQTSIIKEAYQFLCRYSDTRVLAYRAGNLFCNLDTIKALKNNGIRFSSNYNLAYPNCSYIQGEQPRNDIFCIEGVIEVPITCYKEARIRKEWNSFQVSAMSFDEFKEGMRFYNHIGTNVICLLAHSFEFVKSNNPQFNKLRPNNFMIRRFANMCRHLEEKNRSYEVITFGELDKNGRPMIDMEESLGGFYKSPIRKTVTRYFENVVRCRKWI